MGAYLPENTNVQAIGLALGAAAIYAVLRFVGRSKPFSLLDAGVMAVIMAVAGAYMPWRRAAEEREHRKAIVQNLYALRSQIALYKQNHKGEPPVLYQGGLPQLMQLTDARGFTDAASSEQTFGPYFLSGLPTNSVSGSSVITATNVFPPKKASGKRGWLYHQETGQIAIDLPDMLNQ